MTILIQGPRRASHLRQFFMRDYRSIWMLRGSFFKVCAPSCNNVLDQPMFAVDRHQIGDDLLLIGNPRPPGTAESPQTARRGLNAQRSWNKRFVLMTDSSIAIAVSSRAPRLDNNSPKISPAA